VIASTRKTPVTIEKIDFQGWPNSYRMTNGEVELVVTGDVGPRIIRYAFVGGQNLFKEFPDQIGKSGETTWQNRGGHRLWVAPEAPPSSPITYAADNFPVTIKLKRGAIEAMPPLEREAGLQKQIVVKMAPRGSGVEVIHRITNHNAWTIELAAWALSVMAPGGYGITGLPPRGTHPEMLAPTNPLVIWAFTDLSDKRWQFTRKYIILRQDAKAASPQKIGSFCKDTFGAYYLHNELFVKRYDADPRKTYPDMGASFETFTNAEVLELETLGPLTRLAPGETLEHVERWSLHKNVKIGKWTDEELDRVFLHGVL
jgi:hypothetical protein